MVHRAHPLLLLLLAAVLYLPGTGSIPLMDRDEPRFAHATVEMMQRGEWLIPYFNNEYRFDKPPLTYWWMRVHFLLFGQTELAARLHSVLAVWLVALVAFQIGRRVSGRSRAGWWAAVGWLTSFQALVHGRLCVADMPMVLCVALAMWALLELLTTDELAGARRWWWQLWIFLGIGFLAKGPIAWFVPGLALLLWRFVFWRKPVAWKRLRALPGGLVMLAIVAAWGVPALMATHGLFWEVGMGEHVVKRGTQAFNGRVVLPFYYFVTAFISLLPWIMLLPVIWRHVRTHWSAGTALLVSWFVAPYLIFLFYATQLPHYVMPGFPAFFALLGGAVSESSTSLRASRFAWAFSLVWWLLCAIAAAVALWWLPVEIGHRASVLMWAAVLLAAMVAIPWLALTRRPLLALVPVALVSLALHQTGRELRAMHPVVAMSEDLRMAAKRGDLVAAGFTEPSLVFYANHPWKMVGKLDTLRTRLAKRGTSAVVCLRREWTLSEWLRQWRAGRTAAPSTDLSADVDQLAASVPGSTVKIASGLNLARSSWVEIALIIKPQPSATP